MTAAEENRRLRQTMRDLVALSSLPAIWMSLDPDGIAHNLADVLLETLSLDLVYVRLAPLNGAGGAEVVRTPQASATSHLETVRASLAPVLAAGRNKAPSSIPHPLGDGTLHVVLVRLGDESGVLVAASTRPEFPTELDQSLLGVGANHAAAVLQHKRAEEQERQHREWLKVTLASIGDAVIATDTAGKVTFLNPVAEELTGWAGEDARGQALETVFCIRNEQSGQVVENPVGKVLRERVVVGLANHTVLIARDGTERPIDDSAAPIRDSAGRMLGAVLVFRDVSAQRRTEREIRRSEARKSAILETALDCIITIDHEGNVVEFNRAAEETFGVTRAQVLGRELCELIIPPSLRDQHRRGMAHYLATGEGPALGKRLELPALRADGTEFPVEIAITRIATEGPPLFTAYLRDISDGKRAEQHRNTRLAVTSVLNEAASVEAGAGGVLRAVCENMGWDVGFLWTVNDEKTALVCRQSWHRPDVSVAGFESLSRSRTFEPGEGLPGRVWASREPAWISDVGHDVNFPRVDAAAQNNLHSAFAYPVVVGQHTLGVIEFFTQSIREVDTDLLELMGTVAGNVGQFLERRRAEDSLREQTATAETLYRISSLLAQELDLDRLVRVVTDEGTQLSGAQFGAFFYNDAGEQGESYTRYALSGVSREPFAGSLKPGNTLLLAPTFRGEGVIRLDDVTHDPRFGMTTPHFGMPEGDLPVRSYLAVPVISRSGEVIGGLFFGHAEAGVFSARHEQLLSNIAGQAAVAIDNARLYQKMQSSAERLNLALSAADLGDWNWDATTDLVTLSERAAEVFGIPLGPQLTWTAMQGLLREEDRDLAKREVERVVAERIQYALEYRVVRASGQTAWVCVLGRATYDASGNVVGMFGVAQDISERKHLEESLRMSEGRFRGLMEQAPFSIQVFSPDGHTVRVNRAWEELWGVTVDQIAEYNILADEQLEAKGVLSYIQQAFAGDPAHVPAIRYDPNQTIPGQTRHQNPVRWVAAVAYPLKDDAGKVREVVLVHDDITDRRRAEAAVRESEEKLRLMADTIPQLAWMAWPDGSIFWYNRRWYEYTGTTSDQMEGWGWQLVHDPEVLPIVLERWQRSIASGEPFDMVFPLKGADQQFRPFLTRVNALRDGEGRVLYWFGTNTDISDIKRLEDALRDTDRRKDEFLATLAHELRNPLAPIRNSLEILKMPGVDAATLGLTRDMMERQVHHLVRLVDDLLDVSRVMRGKIELRKEPVELATVVASAVETAQTLIDAQGQQLELSLPADSLRIEADPVRLAQVVGNLLMNAAKYTEANGHLWLTAERQGSQVVLAVRDDGIGIAPDMLAHVFELFVQVDHATIRSQGGLGIGLTLVKNLVEMHGGTVEASSAGLGEGCEFRVRLPLMADERQAPNDTAADLRRRQSASSHHRVLIVDDNQDAAVSLAMLLRLHGHEVRVVHDAPAALAAATSYRPDLVFLDIGMPGMDGYAVARQLRQQPGQEAVVLAALAGVGQQADRRRTAEAGFDHHLVKPLQPSDLENLLTGMQQLKR